MNPHLTRPAAERDLVRSYTQLPVRPAALARPAREYLSPAPKPISRAAGARSPGWRCSPRRPVLERHAGPELLLALLDAADPAIRLAAIKPSRKPRRCTAAPKLVTMLAITTPAAAGAGRGGEGAAGGRRTKREPAGAHAVARQAEPGDAEGRGPAGARRGLPPAHARPKRPRLLDQPDPSAARGGGRGARRRTPEGAKLIGERFLAKKLPAELLPAGDRGLREACRSDPAWRKLQAEVMKGGLLVSLDPAQIDKIRKLVATKGDPKKGKRVVPEHGKCSRASTATAWRASAGRSART